VTLSSSTASLGAVTTTANADYSAIGTTTLGGTLNVTTAGFGISAGGVHARAGGGAITLTGSNAANDVTLGTVAARERSPSPPAAATSSSARIGPSVAGVTLNGTRADLQAVTTTGAQNYTASTRPRCTAR
jgi:hypothetical protein